MTLSRPEVLRLIEENRMSPSRALGQNFVADANTVRRIARHRRRGAGGPGGGDWRRPGVADTCPWKRARR